MLVKISVVALVLVFVICGVDGADSSPNDICVPGYFRCADNPQDTTCLLRENFCDGVPDCSNGSDEEDCEQAEDNAFYDHMFKKRPAAEHDDFTATPCVNYSGTCKCLTSNITEASTIVLCSLQNLNHAPENLPPFPLHVLDLTGNNFQVLSREVVDGLPGAIGTLLFSHCGVQRLETNTFANSTSIKHLYLDNNALETFPKEVFEGDDFTLETLSLKYNKLATIHPEAFTSLHALSELDLRGNKLQVVPREALQPLENLITLDLQDNAISIVNTEDFPELPSLVNLTLVNNGIDYIQVGAFRNIYNLRRLYLASNRLKFIHKGIFDSLSHLAELTLSDNRIALFDLDAFENATSLIYIHLERNAFRTLHERVLAALPEKASIYFDQFELCSAVGHVRNCYPKGDGISSHEHLLDNPVLRASVWVMSAIGCTGNLMVLLGCFLVPTNNVVHSLYLRNLALSDLLMGVYLLIVASVDEHYRGDYLRHQYTWRHSFPCCLCGFLSALSHESSVLILSLVTWDRFVSITKPLARKQPSPKRAALTLLVLWLVAATVALAPFSRLTQGYFGEEFNEFYGSNGVCLALHIHEPYAYGWQYSAVMFVLVNTLGLAFICFAYLRMINEIRASGVACRSTRQSQERDKVALRFGVIVLTNCLCWVPVVVVKLLALSGVTKIPATLYAWLAIFVLPINSALNPVLYTLTTTIFKKQVRKLLDTLARKRRTADHHSASESGFSLSFGVFPIGGSTRRNLSNRGTQSTSFTMKNSWKRSTAV